jgi:hypothetical protein
MAHDIFRLTITVQLEGAASGPVFFDIKAVADDGREYAASSAAGDPIALLKKAAAAIIAAYPGASHFALAHDASGHLLG